MARRKGVRENAVHLAGGDREHSDLVDRVASRPSVRKPRALVFSAIRRHLAHHASYFLIERLPDWQLEMERLGEKVPRVDPTKDSSRSMSWVGALEFLLPTIPLSAMVVKQIGVEPVSACLLCNLSLRLAHGTFPHKLRAPARLPGMQTPNPIDRQSLQLRLRLQNPANKLR